jgi:hypothetical protein
MMNGNVQSRFPFFKPNRIPKIPLQILQPIPYQISQLPLPYINLRTLLDQFLHLVLELTRDYITGSLTPGGLGNLLLHALDLGVLLLQHLADLHQIASQLLLLRFHVLANVLLALFKGLVDDEQQPLPQVLELVRDHAVHPGIEVLYLDVDVSNLVTHLHAQVVQTLRRLDAGRLETSTVRHQTSPNIVLLTLSPPRLTHPGAILEVVQ